MNKAMSQLNLFGQEETITERSMKEPFVIVGCRYRSTDPRERKRIVDVIEIKGTTVVVQNVDLKTKSMVSFSRFRKAYVKVPNDTKSVPSGDGPINDAILLSNLSSAILELATMAKAEEIRINDPLWQGRESERRSLRKLIDLIMVGCYVDASNSLRRSKALNTLFYPSDKTHRVANMIMVAANIVKR